MPRTRAERRRGPHSLGRLSPARARHPALRNASGHHRVIPYRSHSQDTWWRHKGWTSRRVDKSAVARVIILNDWRLQWSLLSQPGLSLPGLSLIISLVGTG